MNYERLIYPLYKQSDKKAYNVLKGHVGKIIVKDNVNIDELIKTILISQCYYNYRKIRDRIIEELDRNNRINSSNILKTVETVDIDCSWAVFRQDKEICDMCKKLKGKDVMYDGNNYTYSEFIIRFLLTQLMHDWRGPLIYVLKTSLENKRVNVPLLNAYLALWDFTNIFDVRISILPFASPKLKEKLKDYGEWKGKGEWFLYLYEGRNLIGGAALWPADKKIVIESIYVEKDKWRKGYGTKILFGIELFALKNKMHSLTVGSAKNVVGFYRSFSFSEIEDRNSYVLMEKEL